MLTSAVQPRLRFAIDAGGSSTRLLIQLSDKIACHSGFPSLNPRSVGQAVAEGALKAALGTVADSIGPDDATLTVTGIIASAAVADGTVRQWADLISRAMREWGLAGTVLVTNDVVPLLMGEPLRGCGAALVVGTGSCVLGSSGNGKIVRVGGAEYIGSDEGGAYYLGRSGLVAAIRSLDGRGATTSIRDRMELMLSARIDEIAVRLAGLPYPKPAVADLAPAVTTAWLEDSDPAAEQIVALAIDELMQMVRRAAQVLPAQAHRSWLMTGGVLTNCPPFADRLTQAIGTQIDGDVAIDLVADCRVAAMSMLAYPLVAPHGVPAGLVHV